jgi:hypothetical protein
MTPPYTVVSGYHHSSNSKSFLLTWLENTMRYSNPSRIIVVGDSCDGVEFPVGLSERVIPILLPGDLGSCGALMNGTKDHRFNGWSGSMLAGMMLAYCNETDAIYKEADCLWVGDCVGEMYQQIGDAGIIFGNYLQPDGSHAMLCAQSLFLVRHWFIPEFVSTFLSSPAQNIATEMGEDKFARFEQQNPAMWKRFDFGVDRGRPLPFDKETFYCQQCTDAEIDELQKSRLI